MSCLCGKIRSFFVKKVVLLDELLEKPSTNSFCHGYTVVKSESKTVVCERCYPKDNLLNKKYPDLWICICRY